MDKIQKYTEHSLGVYILMAYLSKIPQNEYNIHNKVYIEFSNSLSSRFAFAKPKNNAYGKHPLLLVQNEEFLWFNKIQWKEIVIKKGINQIYLITERISVPEANLPVIPKFTIVLNINNYVYIEYIANFKNLSIKNIWFDEVNNMHIPKGKNNREIKIEFINDPNYNIFSNEELKNQESQIDYLTAELNEFYQQLERKRIKYQGDKVQVDKEFLDLMK